MKPSYTMVIGKILAFDTSPNEQGDPRNCGKILVEDNTLVKREPFVIDFEWIPETRKSVLDVINLFALDQRYIFQFDLYTEQAKHLHNIFFYSDTKEGK